jgi:hypothetical protein
MANFYKIPVCLKEIVRLFLLFSGSPKDMFQAGSENNDFISFARFIFHAVEIINRNCRL